MLTSSRVRRRERQDITDHTCGTHSTSKIASQSRLMTCAMKNVFFIACYRFAHFTAQTPTRMHGRVRSNTCTFIAHESTHTCTRERALPAKRKRAAPWQARQHFDLALVDVGAVTAAFLLFACVPGPLSTPAFLLTLSPSTLGALQGMHASINIHISESYYPPSKGKRAGWEPNLERFMRHFGANPGG